ncbi:MAG: hypothetical protein IJV71_12185, partial [Lachnospiraceae bacterium]|nr:hypothetical protein [Lachnospiraceae bacterium]
MATPLPNSPKQDRGRVLTASELERKYDLASIAGLKTTLKQSLEGLNKTNAILEEFANATLGSIEDLRKQVDGNITTYFEPGEPTLDNKPANEWDTEILKANHVGDLYYDKDTGYGYRFVQSDGTYAWVKITDNDVVEALAIANAAMDTADGKRRVFTEQPVPPYDSGDLWIKDKDLYVCQISKDATYVYAESDFIIATKYTDDTYAKQVNDKVVVLNGAVTEIKTSVDEWKVEVNSTFSSMDTEIKSAQTQIRANTDGINMKVDKNGVIGAINLTEEEAKIKAARIELEGAVTFASLSSDVSDSITGAQSTADSALAKATSATTTANNATTMATNANTTATNAANTAGTANTNASTALSTANSAKTTADTALSTANSAKTTATTANTNASTALNRATYHYGTCATAAATAAKVVTLSGFTLYTGAQITVQFTYANTAANPTLNVNGTGAKYIRVNNANITSMYYWGANNTVTFVYNGSYWVMADSSANSILANWCSTADKTFIDGSKIYTGSITADRINVNDLFAQEITASNMNVDGGSVAGWDIVGKILKVSSGSTISYWDLGTDISGSDSGTGAINFSASTKRIGPGIKTTQLSPDGTDFTVVGTKVSYDLDGVTVTDSNTSKKVMAFTSSSVYIPKLSTEEVHSNGTSYFDVLRANTIKTGKGADLDEINSNL